MKLLHQTPTRMRFRSRQITSCFDRALFVAKLKTIGGVEDASVNLAAKSFTVHFAAGSAEAIKQEILALDLAKYVSCSKLFSYKENVSSSGITKAALGFLASYAASGAAGKKWITLAAISPLLLRGLKELYTSGINSTSLEALAVGMSAYTGDYTAANSTNLLLEIGEYMEELTVQRSDALLQELAKPVMDSVWVLHDGLEREILYKDLKVGDVVIVNAGDTVAIDGHITAGEGLLNQASMTGESLAVRKQRGDRVLSGTVLEEGRLYVWAESVGAETVTARIGEYIRVSLKENSATGQRANRLADKLVPLTLGLAGLTYALTRDLNRASSVLQADYSCALKLSTPVAFRSSISKLGKAGIMVKGAAVLEKLRDVDTFVFDKTGTLTTGNLEVESVFSFKDGWTNEKILNLAASAEEHYFHPVAQAVVEAAKRGGFVHIHHDEVTFIVAHGVVTESYGKRVVIGSRHFLQDDEKIDLSKHLDLIAQKEQEGKMLLYIGFDGELLGVITLNDTIRHNAKATIAALRQAGVKSIVMLTGDVAAKAQEIAATLGIDDVRAGLEPTQKADIVKDLVASGRKVAFVGDGINDAPALVSASVGISMARGADIAKASADISLLIDDINAVYEAKLAANKTMVLINKNFKLALAANSAILGAAAFGGLTPVLSSVLHNGTTVGLLLNSIRGISLGAGR